MDIKDFEPLFGNWYVESLIGSGSFGKVYKIKREEFGAVYYSALKWISIPRDDAEMKQLRYDGLDNASISEYYKDVVTDLVNEMQLMSRLRGRSSIVSYEDHSVVPKSNNMGYDIFIRMELLISLNDYMQTHELSRADVIRLGINLCEALELCQKYNIIHRDIKPDNIFVAETGEFKLGDFGIARQLEKTTASLSIKGTYYYMAPEVYKGERYNSSVDTYSLGIVLYRLLNDGRLPFLPLNPAPVRQKDRDQCLVHRMSGEKIPLPIKAQGRLGDIILKACAYDSKDRYSTPKQLRDELTEIQFSKGEAKLIYKDQDNLGRLEPSNKGATDPDKTVITSDIGAGKAGVYDVDILASCQTVNSDEHSFACETVESISNSDNQLSAPINNVNKVNAQKSDDKSDAQQTILYIRDSVKSAEQIFETKITKRAAALNDKNALDYDLTASCKNEQAGSDNKSSKTYSELSTSKETHTSKELNDFHEERIENEIVSGSKKSVGNDANDDTIIDSVQKANQQTEASTFVEKKHHIASGEIIFWVVLVAVVIICLFMFFKSRADIMRVTEPTSPSKAASTGQSTPVLTMQTDNTNSVEIDYHNPANDVVDIAQYGAMEVSDDFVLTYSVDEAGLIYRSINEQLPYEMTLGVSLNCSAIVQMIDYSSRAIVDEQIYTSGSSIRFSSFPDGTYYFYVECDGYASYTSEAVQYVHTKTGYDGNGQVWGCSLIPINSTISDPFKIKLVDQAGNAISDMGYNFGVPDALGSIQSCGWTTSNDEGYLTTWGMINDVEYYDVLEFVVYNDRVFKLYNENSDIAISAPKTGNEVEVVIN